MAELSAAIDKAKTIQVALGNAISAAEAVKSTVSESPSKNGIIESSNPNPENDDEATALAKNAKKSQLPVGWKAKWSPDDKRIYYYDLITKKSTWDRPQGGKLVAKPNAIRPNNSYATDHLGGRRRTGKKNPKKHSKKSRKASVNNMKSM